MKNVKNKKMMAVVLPEGCFYGNCSDCVYADRSALPFWFYMPLQS